MQTLQQKLHDFGKAGDWQKFHTPKNLACALSVEAAELLEHFQWLSNQESEALAPEKLNEVRFELADVYMYTLMLADKLNIDLEQAAEAKLAINEQRYPVERVKGSAKKAREYQQNRDSSG